MNWVLERVGCLGLGLGVRVRGKKRFTNRNPKFLVPKFGIIPFFLKFLVPKFGVFPFFLKGSFANSGTKKIRISICKTPYTPNVHV